MAKIDLLAESQCLNVRAASPFIAKVISGVDEVAGFLMNINTSGGTPGWRRVADVSGKLWALPCTLAGLVLGLTGHVVSKLGGNQPQLCFGNNAVQFIGNVGVFASTALVLGNVIIYGRNACPEQCGVYGDACVQLGRHEQAHTYQYQVLGVLFVIVYFLAGGLRGPACNPFERAAQRFGAGLGSWWP